MKKFLNALDVIEKTILADMENGVASEGMTEKSRYEYFDGLLEDIDSSVNIDDPDAMSVLADERSGEYPRKSLLWEFFIYLSVHYEILAGDSIKYSRAG